MKRESRVKKTLKNTTFNLINQILSVLLQFVLRTIFIRCLSLEYLGVNGLFSNILTMLSLSELGLGTAIICNLYKPLAEGDESAIAKYFYVYKKIYIFIGSFIFIVGMILVPFLKMLIKDAPNIPYLNWIYILYLIDSVSSYFFAQYRSLLSADQNDYINASNRTFILFVQTGLQAIILVVFHSFIGYLFVKIICNIVSGYVISLRVKKMYSFVLSYKPSKLSMNEARELVSDSVGVFSTRIAMTVLNSTDNIILSAFLGSIATAYYSNYSLLIGTVSTAIGIMFSTVQASIGNFCVLNAQEENKRMFLNLNYIYYCIYAIATICLGALLTPFINIWLGQEFVISQTVVLMIVLKFYLSNTRQIVLNFITVNHLLQHLNIKNILEVIINLGLSILLVQKKGMIGIFVGTCISLLLTSVWYEPYVLYKRCFGDGLKKYYLKSAMQLFVMLTGVFLADIVVNIVFEGTIIGFSICFIMTIMISFLIVVIPFMKTKEFQYALNMIKGFKNRIF